MLVNEKLQPQGAVSPIEHHLSRALYRAWEGARGGCSAPQRSSLDFRSLGRLLPFLGIAESAPIATGFRWRLAGTLVCDLFRHELTGQPVMKGLNGFESHVVGRFFRLVTHRLQPVVLRFRLLTDFRETIDMEMIGLPLVAADGAIHVLAGVFPFRDSETACYEAVRGIELVAARSIWTEHLPGDVLVRQAEQSSGPGLRLIPGGRS